MINRFNLIVTGVVLVGLIIFSVMQKEILGVVGFSLALIFSCRFNLQHHKSSKFDEILSFLKNGHGSFDVAKRITENRELANTMLEDTPDFFLRNPWALSWLTVHDSFLIKLREIAGLSGESVQILNTQSDDVYQKILTLIHKNNTYSHEALNKRRALQTSLVDIQK